MNTTVICDYCGRPAHFVDSEIVYGGISYGMIWYCADCEAWVGCHRGTDRPLGRLANDQLRSWKRSAHAAFDPLWRGKTRYTRKMAYEWLAQEMGLPLDKTHIGMFNEEQCRKCIDICKKASRRKNHEKHPQEPLQSSVLPEPAESAAPTA